MDSLAFQQRWDGMRRDTRRVSLRSPWKGPICMWMSSKHYQMLLLGTYSLVPSLLGLLQHLIKSSSLVAQLHKKISFFCLHWTRYSYRDNGVTSKPQDCIWSLFAQIVIISHTSKKPPAAAFSSYHCVYSKACADCSWLVGGEGEKRYFPHLW